MVDNGCYSGSSLFCYFFLQLHCKTKPDLYLQNILIATGKNYPLTKLLEKSTARIAVAFPLAIKRSLLFEESFLKSPEEMPYLKIKQCAVLTKAEEPGGPKAPHKRKDLLEIFKIGRRNLR